MLIAFQLQLEQKSMQNRIVSDTEKEVAVSKYISMAKTYYLMPFVISYDIFPAFTYLILSSIGDYNSG